MKKQTIFFVQFFAPGAIVAESWTHNIPCPDQKQIKWPDHAYCCRIYQREDVVDGKNVYRGEPKKIGPLWFHPDSKVETLAEVRKNGKATSTLISNMEINGWTHIVWSRWGNWPQPFDAKKDRVLTT